MSIGATYADSVFINCPFDSDYAPLFDALVFTLFACQFQPRSAKELDDASQTRIDKLYDIIGGCAYGVHDLSRTQLDPLNGLPRFNMPFELGVFLGAKRFGADEQKRKRCLVLDIDHYRYQKFISDLAGADIKAHANRADRLIGCVRDWLAQSSQRSLPSAKRLCEVYAKFLAQLPEIASQLGFDHGAIPYVDFERIVTTWLAEADQPPARARRGRVHRKRLR